MERKDKYFAFISYKREDEEWAQWLQYELEHYHLPSTLNGRTDLPKEFRPIFRDVDELKAGNLSEQIREALELSTNLIVICSPLAVKSTWVNDEITEFISIGKQKGIDNVAHIFPFIVDGTPNSKDLNLECFPKALRDLGKNKERVGGNVNESGRDKAFVKVLAGILPSVSFDMLWNRYERDKAEVEKRKREERDKLLSVQSRFLAEKVSQLAEESDSYLARLLALEILPKQLDNPDRPYTEEAEFALRKACRYTTARFRMPVERVKVDISNDGKYILSFSQYDGDTVVLWDMHTGVNLWEYRHEFATPTSANFSPDGKYFLIALDISVVEIWDTEKRTLVKTVELAACAWSVSFSADCSCLLMEISLNDKDREIQMYDWCSEKTLAVIKENALAYSIVCSSDGRYLAIAYYACIHIWDMHNWSLVQKIVVSHNNQIYAMEFSDDCKSLLSLSQDTMFVWEVETGKNIQTIDEEKLSYASFYSSHLIISAHSDGYICFWNVDNGELLNSFRTNATEIDYIRMIPQLNYIVFTSEWYIHIMGVNVKDHYKALSGHTYCVYSTKFSPDGQYILSASGDKTVRLWNVQSQENIQVLQGTEANDGIGLAVFHPNGKWIAMGTGKNVIELYDFTVNKTLSTFVYPLVNNLKGENYVDAGKYISCIKFSYDGNYILSVAYDSSVRIWDIATGECVLLCSGDGKEIRENSDAAFSPDGKNIAMVSLEGIVELWDVETKNVAYSIKGHSSRVRVVEFSPDGKLFATASADETVKLWNVVDGKLLLTLHGHKGGACSISFSPDSSYLAVGAYDGTLKVWNVRSGKCIDSWSGHDDTVSAVHFSPDGRKIVSGSHDTIVKVWNFKPLQELMEETRKRFSNRSLTKEEREKYYLD